MTTASADGRPVNCDGGIRIQPDKGVGGTGTAACSGDLLLGALAACAQLTCQLVATAMGVPTRRIEVTVSGDMDLQGTLGFVKDVPVGFEAVHMQFDIDALQASPEQLQALHEKTEQYCVVLQTMLHPPEDRNRVGQIELILVCSARRLKGNFQKPGQVTPEELLEVEQEMEAL